MTWVTIICMVIGIAGYAGLGYLAVKEQNKFYLTLRDDLIVRDENNVKCSWLDANSLCWIFEEKTTIAIKNKLLRYLVVAVFLFVWPVSSMAVCVNDYVQYRKLVKMVK